MGQFKRYTVRSTIGHMGWDPIPSTFERARRKEVYRRLARLVTGGGRAGLPHLEHVQSRLRTFEQRYVGIRSIPLDRIVGTAGRADRFSASWLPTKRQTRERWVRLERAFPEGHFPPIVVYKIDES